MDSSFKDLLIKHEKILSALAGLVGDVILVMKHLVYKCDVCKDRFATVVREHKLSSGTDYACDLCAAKVTVEHKDVKWLDIVNCEELRRIQDYADAIEKRPVTLH